MVNSDASGIIFVFLFATSKCFASDSVLTLSKDSGDVDQCSKENFFCPYEAVDCDKIVSEKSEQFVLKLPNAMSNPKDVWKHSDKKMLFIESSDRDHLTTRQACSVESALRNSGLDHFIVALTSKVLNVAANNITCHLIKKYGTTNRLFFVHVDIETFFVGTPMQILHFNGKLKSGENLGPKHTIVHYSDVIRLIFIYRFGGWYSDLDIVVLKDLSTLKNVIASDGVSPEILKTDPDYYGEKVSNAIFNFDAGHQILKTAIEYFPQIFDGTWGSAGPNLLTLALHIMCKTQQQTDFYKGVHTKEQCEGIEILPPKSFYPIDWFRSSSLWSTKSWDEWDKTFKDSYTVHFCQSSSKTNLKVMKKKFYGKEFPAYLPLGLTHCPAAFNSERLF